MCVPMKNSGSDRRRLTLAFCHTSDSVARGNVQSGTVFPEAEFSIGGKEVMVCPILPLPSP